MMGNKDERGKYVKSINTFMILIRDLSSYCWCSDASKDSLCCLLPSPCARMNSFSLWLAVSLDILKILNNKVGELCYSSTASSASVQRRRRRRKLRGRKFNFHYEIFIALRSEKGGERVWLSDIKRKILNDNYALDNAGRKLWNLFSLFFD